MERTISTSLDICETGSMMTDENEIGCFPKNYEDYWSCPIVTFDQLPEDIQKHYSHTQTPVKILLSKAHAVVEFPPDPEGRFDPPGQVDFWKKAPEDSWVLQYSGLVYPDLPR